MTPITCGKEVIPPQTGPEIMLPSQLENIFIFFCVSYCCITPKLGEKNLARAGIFLLGLMSFFRAVYFLRHLIAENGIVSPAGTNTRLSVSGRGTFL